MPLPAHPHPDLLPHIPPHIAKRLPPLPLLRAALLEHIARIEPLSVVIRAAWNDWSILPATVDRTWRFGPPACLRAADGSFPFHWIYAATDTLTAAWEAGLCANDAEQPGTFYIPAGARHAFVATLSFEVPLVLADLNGIASSKLGIFDQVSSPDHEWCQWFGCMVDAVVAERGLGIDGMLYPSRKHRGHDAIALSSRAMARLLACVAVSHRRFGATPAYEQLLGDPCCVPPP